MKKPKEDIVFIDHMLQEISRIHRFCKQDVSSLEIEYAVIRALEIIGEAAKNLSTDFKKNHSHVPWKEISGTRDVLIHGYFGIAMPKVWKIVYEDLPNLEKQLHEIKKNMSS